LDLLHRRDLTANLDGATRRWGSSPLDRSSHLSGDRPQVVADHVGRQGDLSLHVVAIVLTRHAARLDAVLGSTFELQFRDRLTSYLGRLMRRGRLLRNDEVLDAIEQAVDPDEADEVLRVDAIASGIIDGVASHVVAEVSATCGVDDIDRAARRAGILRKAGLAAVPLVACKVISPELRSYARSKQVRIWCDGTMLDAAA
jgi:hypothetical protein